MMNKSQEEREDGNYQPEANPVPVNENGFTETDYRKIKRRLSRWDISVLVTATGAGLALGGHGFYQLSFEKPQPPIGFRDYLDAKTLENEISFALTQNSRLQDRLENLAYKPEEVQEALRNAYTLSIDNNQELNSALQLINSHITEMERSNPELSTYNTKVSEFQNHIMITKVLLPSGIIFPALMGTGILCSARRRRLGSDNFTHTFNEEGQIVPLNQEQDNSQ